MTAPTTRTAAIVTVGTEIVTGLLVDTNTAEIARSLVVAGYDPLEAVSAPDDPAMLAATMVRLCAAYDLVVVTGGLGPTHDDVTREAAARATGRPLARDSALEAGLRAHAARHRDARAAEQVLKQADMLEGARVLPALKGTAPGVVLDVGRATMVLLPGPPREMRPMLAALTREWGAHRVPPVVLRCNGIPESDAQLAAQDVLAGRDDVALTVLAAPGDVRVILHDRGAGPVELAALADRIAERIGSACYSNDGSSLPETLLRLAQEQGVTLATAESCTGGLVAAALTHVAGASAAFAGGVVGYSNESKSSLLDVPPGMLGMYGAVSEQVAVAMAQGARDALDATWAVSVTGIAGPAGGTPDKPVGTVWFAIAGPSGSRATLRTFTGDREVVRARSVATALDLLRRALLDS